MKHAPTGKELAAARLVAGISRRTLAAHMQISSDRLARMEQAMIPPSSEIQGRWHTALIDCAQDRRQELASIGLTYLDISKGAATLAGILRAGD